MSDVDLERAMERITLEMSMNPWQSLAVLRRELLPVLDAVRLEEHKMICSRNPKCLRCLTLGDERAIAAFKRSLAELEASK